MKFKSLSIGDVFQLRGNLWAKSGPARAIRLSTVLGDGTSAGMGREMRVSPAKITGHQIIDEKVSVSLKKSHVEALLRVAPPEVYRALAAEIEDDEEF